MHGTTIRILPLGYKTNYLMLNGEKVAIFSKMDKKTHNYIPWGRR